MTKSKKSSINQSVGVTKYSDATGADADENSSKRRPLKVSDKSKTVMKASQLVAEHGSDKSVVSRLEGEDLQSSLDEALARHGVDAEQRKVLTSEFTTRVADVTTDSDAVVKMPDSPPEMWQAGQGENALEFLHRVYGPQVEARLLTYTWLDENDDKLKHAVQTFGSRKKIPEDQLPVTKREAIDIEYQTLREKVGPDVFDRIIQLERTMKRRGSRANLPSDHDGVEIG
ncbi:hypothetical protein [Epibacterium ulvae]|uniref:hypothetical protein n=1 Tax=Epibacterium ulvae TaxID=1156985 RepID=UPI00249389D8|nr:hypothetical protein [Epibacterium ulvae]